MFTIGIDLGSRFIKLIISNGDQITRTLAPTVEFYRKNIIREADGVSLVLDGIPANARIIATGYGRNLLDFKNASTISEIKAHFYGAKTQSSAIDFILVDIGGQDCKVIQARDGYINDFTMNDKCAASTGRFIEQAAAILNMPVEDFMRQADNPCRLPDTCAVFCESEIIGLLARGHSETELAAGVNLSVARRLAPQIKRYAPDSSSLRPPVFASGGAAASSALLGFLSELTGMDVTPLADTQFNGALGCLFYQSAVGNLSKDKN